MQHRAGFSLISDEVPNNGGNHSPTPQTQRHPTVCPGCTGQRTPPSPSAAGSHKCSAVSSLLPMRQGVRCIRLFVSASFHPISPSPLGRGAEGGVGSLRPRTQPGLCQPCQRLRNQPHRFFKVCVGCAKAEAETDRGFSLLTTQPDSPQNMRRLGDTRGAGRTSRGREVRL